MMKQAHVAPLAKRAVAITLVAAGLTVAGAAAALAGTVEANVGGGCRIGAEAFEHWTKARHVAYDDNGRCGKIQMLAITRCWGKTYRTLSSTTTSDRIDWQFGGCDAIGTTTYAYDARGSYLGQVTAWQ